MRNAVRDRGPSPFHMLSHLSDRRESAGIAETNFYANHRYCLRTLPTVCVISSRLRWSMISSREPEPLIRHVASIPGSGHSPALQPGIRRDSVQMQEIGREAESDERQCDLRRVNFSAVRILLERVRKAGSIAWPRRETERI